MKKARQGIHESLILPVEVQLSNHPCIGQLDGTGYTSSEGSYSSDYSEHSYVSDTINDSLIDFSVVQVRSDTDMDSRWTEVKRNKRSKPKKAVSQSASVSFCWRDGRSLFDV